jgi:hypothetical protein
VNNSPLSASCLIKLGVYAEDGNNVSSLSLDMLLQVKEGVFDTVLQCFLEVLVKLSNKLGPGLLDLVSTVNELFSVSVNNSLMDECECLLEVLLVLAELILLCVDERVQVVELLGDRSQICVAYSFDDLVDLTLALLENLDFVEDVEAFLAAELDKHVYIGLPVVPEDTRLNSIVQLGKMLLEKIALIISDQVLNVVVFTDNCHDILTQLSESLVVLE